MDVKLGIYGLYKRIMTHVGDIMLATAPPKTKAEQILKMLSVIKKGDIICRKYNYYLDSYLIPGEYTHSGIVKSKDEMIHSIAEGVQFIHPIDFIKDTDGFIVLRPTYTNESAVDRCIARAIENVNNKVEYDFTFNDPNKLYCHELTADCLAKANIKISRTTFYVGVSPFKIERTTYLAENIIRDCSKIYEF